MIKIKKHLLAGLLGLALTLCSCSDSSSEITNRSSVSTKASTTTAASVSPSPETITYATEAQTTPSPAETTTSSAETTTTSSSSPDSSTPDSVPQGIPMWEGTAPNGNIITGVYQSATGGISVTDSCFLNDNTANAIASYVRKIMTEQKILPFDNKNGRGTVRHILVRNGYKTGEYMVVIVCYEDNIQEKSEEILVRKLSKRFSEIKTIILNISKSNKMTLGAKERYQVNPVQTELLYKTAIEYAQLNEDARILDAYCGIGTIGIAAAESAKVIVGVEINGDAVKDAEENARINGISNAVYHNCDAADYMTEAAEKKEKFNVVFTDPPRAGCSRKFLMALTKLLPEKIVYISCNPETLARDLYFLVHNGYKVKAIQPVDMFPHTKHVECVVLMTKCD